MLKQWTSATYPVLEYVNKNVNSIADTAKQFRDVLDLKVRLNIKRNEISGEELRNDSYFNLEACLADSKDNTKSNILQLVNDGSYENFELLYEVLELLWRCLLGIDVLGSLSFPVRIKA